MDEIWDKLCSSTEALKNGWHLATQDLYNDSIDIPFLKEQFAADIDNNLVELLRRLRTGVFFHDDVIRSTVSKGDLSSRPIAFIPLESRIVLFAGIALVAKQIDRHLPDGVFSFRVKDKAKKGALFKTGALTRAPFIKKKLRRHIDPFEDWYEAWPKFYKKSIKICAHGDYQYLVVSDISAYFENIQLEILRDQLFELIPEEPKLINLFISALSVWTSDTPQRRRYMRGIPQGSDVSRFFGNIFLQPIDKAMVSWGESQDTIYYRYMDDVRIFAKSEKSAVLTLSQFENEVRSRHLNLQSSKTKILNEKNKQVSHLLIDKRNDRFDHLNEAFDYPKHSSNTDIKQEYLKQLTKLRSERPDSLVRGEQKIEGAHFPLKGLTDRLFRRLAHTHLELNDDSIVPRIISEVKKNGDQRYGKLIIQTSKKFPRKRSIQTALFEAIRHSPPIHPSREAQFLKACRYQSRVRKNIIEHCWERALDETQHFQVRQQAFALLARTKLSRSDFTKAKCVFNNEKNIWVKRASAMLLIRLRGENNATFVRSLVFHPNNEIRKFGLYVYQNKTNEKSAEILCGQAFKVDTPWLLVDYIPLLFLASQSNEYRIRSMVCEKIRSNNFHKSHIYMDMRDLLNQILNWQNEGNRIP